jgi:hypothetical protein
MDYINNLAKRIEKLKTEDQIVCSIEYSKHKNGLITVKGMKINFPGNILCFYDVIRCLNIEKPHHLEILSIENMSIIENRYLHFSTINSVEKIYFDMSKTNSANEWNIINLSNNFEITLTIGSFLTNKVWAWIDRGREIWKEETYAK